MSLKYTSLCCLPGGQHYIYMVLLFPEVGSDSASQMPCSGSPAWSQSFPITLLCAIFFKKIPIAARELTLYCNTKKNAMNHKSYIPIQVTQNYPLILKLIGAESSVCIHFSHSQVYRTPINATHCSLPSDCAALETEGAKHHLLNITSRTVVTNMKRGMRVTGSAAPWQSQKTLPELSQHDGLQSSAAAEQPLSNSAAHMPRSQTTVK